jgi:nitrate/nitrite transporter NarK
VKQASLWQAFLQPAVFVMLPIYFLQNCAAYGCMTFLGEGLKSQGLGLKTEGPSPTGIEYGVLFAVPYAVAAVCMVVNSWHSDKTGERRGHVALAYAVSGASLIASVLVSKHSFWLSYMFLCLAVPGPFSGLAPFWAIPAETLPRNVLGAVMGLVNAIGNVGGFLGQYIVGYLKKETGGITVPFSVLGMGLLVGAALCFLLPKARMSAPVLRPYPAGAK